MDHVPVMRIGHLRRSLVALLMLALASTWQLAPSFAAEPCRMTEPAAAPYADANPCAQVAGDCIAATICCQAAPTLFAPQNTNFSLMDWHRIVWAGALQILIGLRLQPALHPPTIRA